MKGFTVTVLSCVCLCQTRRRWKSECTVVSWWSCHVFVCLFVCVRLRDEKAHVQLYCGGHVMCLCVCLCQTRTRWKSECTVVSWWSAVDWCSPGHSPGSSTLSGRPCRLRWDWHSTPWTSSANKKYVTLLPSSSRSAWSGVSGEDRIYWLGAVAPSHARAYSGGLSRSPLKLKAIYWNLAVFL